MDPIIAPTKSHHIGMRQIGSLSNLSPEHRWALIAEGMPLLLKSAEGLYAGSRAMKDDARTREILEGHAEEESAKILILLDFARCPPGRSEDAQLLLKRFYDHGSRLMYAKAATWRPTDVDELRGYVDHERRSHYLEGFAGEYILPNSQIFSREARLYADLIRNQDGSFAWNDPSDIYAGESRWHMPPAALQASRSLSRAGALTAAGLGIVNRIWSSTPFKGPQHSQDSDALIQQTLEALVGAELPMDDAEDSDVATIYSCWQLPMYAIETRMLPVDLDDLLAAQERELYAQM